MRLESESVAGSRVSHSHPVSDDEVVDDVLHALYWNYAVPRDRLNVRVDGGWVTLTGDVDWSYQRDSAAADALKVRGATGVTNKITLAPVEPVYRRPLS